MQRYQDIGVLWRFVAYPASTDSSPVPRNINYCRKRAVRRCAPKEKRKFSVLFIDFLGFSSYDKGSCFVLLPAEQYDEAYDVCRNAPLEGFSLLAGPVRRLLKTIHTHILVNRYPPYIMQNAYHVSPSDAEGKVNPVKLQFETLRMHREPTMHLRTISEDITDEDVLREPVLPPARRFWSTFRSHR